MTMQPLVNLLIAVSAMAVLTTPALADLQRFVQVSSAVYRGDQPDEQVDYETLQRQGIRTILNLRNDASVETERQVAARMGFQFENVPMGVFFIPSEGTVNRALGILSDPARQPVYVHCEFGKDRTGMIMGLYRVFYQGWTRRDAYGEMRGLGFNPFAIGLSTYFYTHTPESD